MLWEGSDFAEILQSQEGLGWADAQDEGTGQESWFKLGIKSDDDYTAAETHISGAIKTNPTARGSKTEKTALLQHQAKQRVKAASRAC